MTTVIIRFELKTDAVRSEVKCGRSVLRVSNCMKIVIFDTYNKQMLADS
jgi:hypothetical protein